MIVQNAFLEQYLLILWDSVGAGEKVETGELGTDIHEIQGEQSCDFCSRSDPNVLKSQTLFYFLTLWDTVQTNRHGE